MSGTFWQRLRGRVSNGLLLQELLDRLARLGVVCYPYVVGVTQGERIEALPPPPGCSSRALTADDAESLLALVRYPIALDELRARLARERCHGVYLDGRLIAYAWASFEGVPAMYHGGVLLPLRPDEAYVFETYVSPAHRGLRLAPWLSSEMVRGITAAGRPTLYSTALLFNRSTRRFMFRAGVVEREWRVALQLRLPRLPGADLRLWRRGSALRTPAFLRRPPPRAG